MNASHTISGRVYEWVQRAPQKNILHFRDTQPGSLIDNTLTYEQLWKSASAFAQALETLPRGSRVMIVLPLGLRVLSAHLGIQLAGAIGSIFAHPSEKVDISIYGHRLNHTISLLKPEAVITSYHFFETVQDTWKNNGGMVIVEEDIPLVSEAEVASWRAGNPEDIAIIQHSSGSTGFQKAVALNHVKVLEQCDSYGRFIGISPQNDRVCSWLPLYHDMGLFTSWLLPVLNGIPVSMIDPFEWAKKPATFLNLITDVHGTLCWLPNFSFHLLVSRFTSESLRSHGVDLSSMRGFTNCSEPVSAQGMRNFHLAFQDIGVKEEALWTCYAMAENSFAVTGAGGAVEKGRTIQVSATEYSNGKIELAKNGKVLSLISCGVPIQGCEVKVVGKHRQTLLEGKIGEIALRSPFMLKEYVNDPKATQTAIDEDGWFYTGDLGFLLDGRLFVTGRIKDLLIVGGRNFYPQDIEKICDTTNGAIPGRSVALGMQDESLGTQKVIVLVESHLPSSSEKVRLASLIRQRVFDELDCPVADVKVVPHMWLLKTSSGKIARQPNLDRYKQELLTPKVTSSPKSLRSSEKILSRFPVLLQQFVWSLAIALAIYFFLLTILIGANKSWNLYAGF